MKQDERRINAIEHMASRNEVDNRVAEVAALCELARAVHRLGDLYLTDLILHGALGDENLPGRSGARRASQTFLRRAYENDARSKSSPGT